MLLHVLGVGTDIVSVGRIKSVMQSFGERFLKKVMTEREIEFCTRPSNFDQVCLRVAGTFSAKEAVFKALRIKKTIVFKEIEVIRNPFPSVVLYGETKRMAVSKGVRKVLVSIAHEHDFAVAFAVALGIAPR